MSIISDISNRRSFLRNSMIAGSAVLFGEYNINSTKRIALIGDSVRTGYQPDVFNNLIQKAQVWGPEDDQLNTIDILQNLPLWLRDNSFDVIHINSGLNDLRTIDYQVSDNLIPLEFYSKNVERIIKLINRYSPGSVIVWATTTPVIEKYYSEFHKNTQDFRMKNDDVIKYNEASIKVISRLGVALNDLYTYLMSGDPESIILEDGVHFNIYGTQLIAERIITVMEKIIQN
jgi:lysophospholipase L1-like esterase